MLSSFQGSWEVLQQIIGDDTNTIKVMFNETEFNLRKSTFTKTSCLIAELIDEAPENEMIEINLSNVNSNTFKAAQTFFNSGFVVDDLDKNVCIIELMLLSDYMQSPILYEFCYSKFISNWSRTIPKAIFHHTYIPFNIFNNLLNGIAESGHESVLQIWTQYTCRSKTYGKCSYTPDFIDQISTMISKIDLDKCSFSSIKAAEAKMPECVFRHLRCSGLIRKMSKLCAASVLSARSEGAFYLLKQATWNDVFGVKQAFMPT